MKRQYLKAQFFSAVGFAVAGCTVLLCTGWHYGYAQSSKGDGLFADLVKTETNATSIMIVYWMPKQVLQELGKSNATGLDMLLEKYVVILAGRGEKGAVGLNFMPEEQVRDSILLTDARGVGYTPLKPENLDPDLKLFLSMMKPVFAQMFGQFGEGMHPFVFKAFTVNGEPIADAAAPGSFTIRIGSTRARYDLPLPSLLPGKICRSCGKSFAGNFVYCPFDGTLLTVVSDATESAPHDFVEVEQEPVVIRKVNPEYPELALRAGLEGVVWVKIWVGKDGTPKKLEILKSDAEIFNDASIKAARQMRFKPAIAKGKPVGVWVSVPFRFRLVDKGPEDQKPDG